MMDQAIFKNYTFDEWVALPVKEQWLICIHYWSLFPVERGKPTRNALIRAFLREYPDFKKAAAVGFGWRGRFVECIFVVTEDSSAEAPVMFCNFPVSKGILQAKLYPEEWVVDW